MRRPTAPIALVSIAIGTAACVSIPFDHPDDRGGGEGSVIIEPAEVEASADTAIDFRFIVGRSGIVQGGGFRIQLPVDPVHRFLGFTPPQARHRLGPGFVSCQTERDGVRGGGAVAEAGAGGEARCLLASGSLAPGDSLVMRYRGLTPRVSGDYPLHVESRVSGGRGGRRIEQAPLLRVGPRPARVMIAVIPSLVRRGEPVTLTLAALDEFGNLSPGYEGAVEILWGGRRLKRRFTAAQAGVLVVEGLVARGEGFVRAEVIEQYDPPELAIRATSNPARIIATRGGASARSVLWGDPHFHTGSGAGHRPFLDPALRAGDRRGNYTSQREAFAHARSVTRLDFAAATEYATAALEEAEPVRRGAFSEPGRFTALQGFHWHDILVLHEGTVRLLVLEDRRLTDEPEELAAVLAASPGMEVTVGLRGAAAGPGAPDADAFEIDSWLNRGDDYGEIVDPFEPTPSWAARGVGLRRGRITVMAGSANHWGRPGTIDLTGLEPGAGGLTAVLADENTPASILEAVKEGRTWATTGPRIFLRAWSEGRRVHVEAAGQAVMKRVDLVVVTHSGIHLRPLLDDPSAELIASIDLPATDRPALWYVRVVQEDLAMAWSSPTWFGPGSSEHAAGEGR